MKIEGSPKRKKMTKADIFVMQNRLEDKIKIHISPSRKYRLVIAPYQTGDGYWNYTEGTVLDRDKELDKPIAIIQRNYSHFWFAWLEGHANGHDYLLCGEDYQGQTVIQLDEPMRTDYVPTEAVKGFGFCWVNVEPYKTDDGDDRLTVNGCYWAAPFEFLDVDFRQPFVPPYPILSREWEAVEDWDADDDLDDEEE